MLTFGDLQHRLNQVPRTATALRLGVESAGEAREVELALPDMWWFYDNTYRYWTIDPQVFFDERSLSTEERAARGLGSDGFACEVTRVNPRAQVLGTHELQVGDVVLAYDGVRSDPLSDSCALAIRLNVRAGDSVRLSVLRGDETIELPLETHRQYYRKAVTGD